MVEVLRPYLERTGKRGGQNKLSVEDQLLVVLEYWRSAYDAPPPGNIELNFILLRVGDQSEAAVCRLIQKVEQLLLGCGKFRLPGKKQQYPKCSLLERRCG